MSYSSGGSGAPAGSGNAPAPSKGGFFPPIDLEDIRTEYDRIGRPLINYFTRLQELDDWYFQREQTDPFIEILDVEGNNTVRQISSNEIRVWGERLISYITPEHLTVEVQPALNPRADTQCLQHIKNAIEFTWHWNDMYRFGSLLTRRMFDLVCRGLYVAQYSWLDSSEANQVNGGYPIMVTMHDVFNTRWELDSDGMVNVVILAKKRMARQIREPWLQTAGQQYSPTDEVEIYEYWDRENHGVVIGGTVVKELTPHKYTSVDGTPICPFAIPIHLEHDENQADTSPQFSGTGLLSVRVGTPVLESLLPVVRNKSKLLTAQFESIRRAAIPVIAVHDNPGREIGDIAQSIEEGILVLPKDGKAEWMTPPPIVQQIGGALDYYDKTQVGTAGAASSILSGTSPTGTSMLSTNASTNLARQNAMMAAKTLSVGLTREAMIICGLIKANTKSSTARNYFAASGFKLDSTRPGDYTDGAPLAHSSAMTGSDQEPIDPYTFNGFRIARVAVVPEEREPAAAKRTAGLQLLSMQQLRMPLDYIYAEYFEHPNPQELLARLDMEALVRDPNLPFMKLNGLMRYLQDLTGTLDPGLVDQAKSQAQQALPQIVQATIQQILAQALPQGGGALAQPGGAPGGPPVPGPQGAPGPLGAGQGLPPRGFPPVAPAGLPSQSQGNMPPPLPGHGVMNGLVAHGVPPQIPPTSVGQPMLQPPGAVRRPF